MKISIRNPKRNNGAGKKQKVFYPYYAGFSEEFAQTLISSLALNQKAVVLDPWNGSGTTTTIASRMGYFAEGYDLNPVMVIAAKARLLGKEEKDLLLPITEAIIEMATYVDPIEIKDDPLCLWFIPQSTSFIRSIQRAIHSSINNTSENTVFKTENDFQALPNLVAFFYTSLFRSIRQLLKPFFSSNPTWIKKPRKKTTRIRPGFSKITAVFESEVLEMVNVVSEDKFALSDIEDISSNTCIKVASSDLLPTPTNSVDLILSSPPYCTRIDYAVATMPELAVLGYTTGKSFDKLRRELIGTSTVPKSVPDPNQDWGLTCNTFIHRIAAHGSKASSTYYYKSHVQYFNSIYESMKELKRALRPAGACVLVVQDSYYKDIHNDLPNIFIEMARANKLKLIKRTDFHHSRTMAGINPKIRNYRETVNATESVLCFINS